MTELTNKQNGVGVTRIIKATSCSFKGFKAAWIHESAFRQELLMAILIMPLSFVLANTTQEWVMLCSVLLLVLFAEMLNSAIEAIADSVTREHHELIGRAKDMGSSAVFIALSIFLLVWGESLIRWLF